MNKKLFLVFVLILLSQLAFSLQLTLIKPKAEQEFAGQYTIEVEVSVSYGDGEKASNFSSWIYCQGITPHKVFDIDYEPETTSATLKANFSAFGKANWCKLIPTVSYKTKQGYYTSASTEPVWIIITSGWPQTDGSLVAVRNFPSITFYPGSKYNLVTISYKPKKTEITGVIFKETLPEGFEPSDNIDAALSQWGVSDYTYDPATRTLKMVLMNSPGISTGVIQYILSASENFQPGQEVTFSGTWEILNETGEILGEQSIKSHGFKMPGCPMSDQVLLEYINKWSKLELSDDENENDTIIMQILGVWKSCANI